MPDIPDPFPIEGQLMPADPSSLDVLSNQLYWKRDWDEAQIAIFWLGTGELEGAGPAEQVLVGLIRHIDLRTHAQDGLFDERKVYEMVCIAQRNRIRLEVLAHFERWREGNGQIESMFDPIRDALPWNVGYPEIMAFDEKLKTLLALIYDDLVHNDCAKQLWIEAGRLGNELAPN